MPAVNGVKINIISQWELKVHPEFLHPDSLKTDAFDDSDDGDTSFDGSPFSYRKHNRREQKNSISVYTPSVPG